MRRGWPAARTWLALVIVLALALAACGDDDDDGGGGGAERATVTVGVIPIADVAPLFLGRDKGFFEEENLRVETQFAEGGAVIVPSVVKGDFDFGFSNNVSLFLAQSENLPLKIVTQGVLGGANDKEAWANLLVKGDGPIKTPKDLEGRTIAVNTLKNICEVTIKASLEKEGVDVGTLKFQEIPFPDMNPALAADRVDGLCQVEPFVSQGEQEGFRGVDPFYVGTAPNLSVATYFTSDRQIEEDADVVERFIRAMNRSLDYADEHPDEVRKIIPEYTEIPPEAAEAITLPQWSSSLERDTLEKLGSDTRKYGLIDEEPDIEALIHQGE
jgi:NitT/TauT family transport system substrate-binding protein